jgi:hypothetical protein
MALSEDTGGGDRSTYLFHHLVAMFETLAFQQLGKLVNPITGQMERDLRQARITIDMIEMIREKTAGNLSGDEGRLLDSVLLELQMNYVDESKRPEGEEKSEEPGGGTAEETPDDRKRGD